MRLPIQESPLVRAEDCSFDTPAPRQEVCCNPDGRNRVPDPRNLRTEGVSPLQAPRPARPHAQRAARHAGTFERFARMNSNTARHTDPYHFRSESSSCSPPENVRPQYGTRYACMLRDCNGELGPRLLMPKRNQLQVSGRCVAGGRQLNAPLFILHDLEKCWNLGSHDSTH